MPKGGKHGRPEPPPPSWLLAELGREHRRRAHINAYIYPSVYSNPTLSSIPHVHPTSFDSPYPTSNNNNAAVAAELAYGRLQYNTPPADPSSLSRSSSPPGPTTAF
jgi:hypothetical protein